MQGQVYAVKSGQQSEHRLLLVLFLRAIACVSAERFSTSLRVTCECATCSGRREEDARYDKSVV